MNAKLFEAMLRHGIGFNPWNFEKYMDTPNFPPHNITEIDDRHYRLTIAVAGFKPEELQIALSQTADGQPLMTVSGKKADGVNEVSPAEDVSVGVQHHKVLHRGIAYRNFSREFLIGDNVEIEKASLQHGLLEIDLIRHIPEAPKPKLIPIQT